MPSSNQLDLLKPNPALPPHIEELRRKADAHLPRAWLDVVCAAQGAEASALLHCYRALLWAVPAPSLWRSYSVVFPDAPLYGGYLRARTGKDLSRSLRALWGQPGQRRHLDHRAWKSWLAYADGLTELGQAAPLVWVDGSVGPVTSEGRAHHDAAS